MVATAKPPTPNLALFQNAKAIVNDAYEHFGDAIAKKETKLLTASVFKLLDGLVREVEAFGPPKDARRFAKIQADTATILDERAAAIAGGRFVLVSLTIYAALRFLVRELEALYLKTLDPDAVKAVKGERLADEEQRVVLDLADAFADPEPNALTAPLAK